jgi:CheY-like chemotaxis protein
MSERPRIAILDDDEIFGALLTTSLEESYECMLGRTGRDGLKICRSNRVDLLITDIGMPELDGVQMLAEFQKDRLLAAIPVLVFTATHFTQRTRSQVARFPQVRNILLKPCPLERLMEAITVILKATGKLKQ